MAGSTLGQICPNGDLDYYVFHGTAGDQVGLWTEAQVLGSPLDTHITLLDSDGRSMLESNDDQVQYERPDSWLSYTLKRSGDYYIRVRAWDNPSAGGEAYSYTLHLVQEKQNPIGIFVDPGPDGFFRSKPLTLSVFATDGLSGVSHVRFYWHSPDWQSSEWMMLGDDWDGSDGWNFAVDTSTLPGIYGGAFYAQIFDQAGNWFGTGLWNLKGVPTYLPLIIRSR